MDHRQLEGLRDVSAFRGGLAHADVLALLAHVAELETGLTQERGTGALLRNRVRALEEYAERAGMRD